MENKNKRAFVKDIAAHVLAILILLGFFVIALVVFLGYVDINNPAVIALVSSVIGYAAGNIRPVASYYYGREDKEEKRDEKS